MISKENLLKTVRLLSLMLLLTVSTTGCASYKVLENITGIQPSNEYGFDWVLYLFGIVPFWVLALVVFFACFNEHKFRKEDFFWNKRHDGEWRYENRTKKRLIGHEEDENGNIIKNIYEEHHYDNEVYDPPMWEHLGSGATVLAYILYFIATCFLVFWFTKIYPEYNALILVAFLCVCGLAWFLFHKYLYEYIEVVLKILVIIILIAAIIDFFVTIGLFLWNIK